MKTIPQILTVADVSAVSVDISQEARARRDTLLVLAKNVTVVTSAEECRIATEALKNVKEFTRSIEDARKDVKAPVITLGKRIDEKATEMTGLLEKEADRLSRCIGAYTSEQQRKEHEAKKKAWEEEQRIIAENNRKLEEARANARSDAAFERKAEKIEAQTFDAIAETRAAVAAVAEPTPEGIATRTEIKFAVTDIEALYGANAAFVILSPNNAAIKAALKQLPEGKSLPGVRHWKEAKVSVR